MQSRSPGSWRPPSLPAPHAQTLRGLRERGLASANSSGLIGESHREEAGGKNGTLLLPETPKSGPSPVQGVKDRPFRFSLHNLFGLHEQWDRAGSKQGRSFQCTPGCSPGTAQSGQFSRISAAGGSCRRFSTCALGQSPDSLLRWEQASCLLKAAPGEAGGRGDGEQSWPHYK